MNYNELIKWLDKWDSLGIRTLGEVERFTHNAKSKPNDTNHILDNICDRIEELIRYLSVMYTEYSSNGTPLVSKWEIAYLLDKIKKEFERKLK